MGIFFFQILRGFLRGFFSELWDFLGGIFKDIWAIFWVYFVNISVIIFGFIPAFPGAGGAVAAAPEAGEAAQGRGLRRRRPDPAGGDQGVPGELHKPARTWDGASGTFRGLPGPSRTFRDPGQGFQDLLGPSRTF